MELVVFTIAGCPFCEKAKGLLREKGIGFKEIDAPVGSREWRDMKERTGSGSLPQAFVRNAPVGGYADLVHLEATGELYEMLGIAGKKPGDPLYDVLILGAGPSGLSAAIYTSRKLLKTLVVSKDIGGQVGWTSDVENYLGFSHVNALDLVSRFEEHVRKFGVETLTGSEIASVDLTGRIKRVITDEGKAYLSKTLIIATGGRHRPLNIPGEHELIARGVSYCSTCDAPLFGGADVAVIGGGNSGLEAVLDLVPIAGKIHLVSATSLTGDPAYQGKIRQSTNVEIFTDHEPLRILGDTEVKGIELRSIKTGEVKSLAVEGVFVEIGIMPNSSLFIDTLATNQKGEVLVDAGDRKSVV